MSAGEEIIDLTEYFGSEDASHAVLIRYVQLKHSTMAAEIPWTASGFRRTIEGFAAKFRSLVDRDGSAAWLGRLQFVFVSNRPISAQVLETVAAAADGGAPPHPAVLAAIKGFARLPDADFRSFCGLLSFESGQDSLRLQRNTLAFETNGYLQGGD